MGRIAITDMSVEELKTMVKQLIHEELDERKLPTPKNQRALLDWKPVTLGLRPGAPEFISREDFYDADCGSAIRCCESTQML